MPYGQGQMLGAGVDPRMFVQDYSGFTRAAEIQAQGMQNLGAMIGKGIEDFGEARKERKKIDAEIKATSAGIESAIKMGKDLGIDIESYLAPVQARINDPNTSPVEALALGRTAAQGISNAFTLGIGAQDRAIKQNQLRSENAFRLANLEVAQQRANIYGQKAQAEASELTQDTIKAFDPDTGQDKEWNVLRDKQGNLFTPDKKSRIVDPDKYIYGEPGGVEELPPTSQYNATGISNALSMVGTPDVSIKSSISKVNIPYNGVPAPNRYNNPGGAYPSEKFLKYGLAGKGIIGGGHPVGYYPNLESGIAANMAHFKQMKPVGKTVGEMRHYWTKGKWGGRTVQPGMDTDEVITQEKLNDPEWMGKWMRTTAAAEGFRGSIPDEKIASGFKFYQSGGVPQGPSQASQSVPTTNPSDSITRVGEIIPEIWITPSQQSDLASQIEQGQNLQTAQAGGGMPTEPRLNQQPQPAPRRMVGGRPVGGGQQQQGTIMTQQQVNELEASGRQVSAVPMPDGNFRVTSVRTGAPQMGFEMTYDEQGRPVLKQSATGVGATPKVGEGQILSTDASGRPSIVNIPGGKADIEAQKAVQAAENERKFELDRAGIVLSEIDKLIGYAGEMSRLPGASTYRKFAPMAGFEGASEVENTLDTVKAGFRFETLQRLKEASPTGSSGLGAVTKPEFDALAEEKGKLTQVGDPRELQRRATNYKKMVLDTIHGSKQDRDKLLKEGKITRESYDAVESLYPGFQKKQPLAPEVIDIRKRLLGK